MEYIKEITVDLSGEMYFNYITAVQGDEKSRFVKITILSGGLAFFPTAGARAALRCKKPDGTFVLNDATIGEDGAITTELTENMLAAVGNCRCEVTIYEGESSLTTVPFIVKVTPGAVDPEIESTDEYTALTKALADVQGASGVAGAALETATDALNKMSSVEADIDKHTSAANAATERANTAAEQAEAVVDQAAKIVTRYGVRFEGSANSGSTVKRLYNAVGLVAGVGTDTEKPQNDFDNIYPWSARRRCCGAWGEDGNFVVNAYKGEPGYAEDGTNGEVWVEHSVFYYKHTYEESGAEEIVISATPLADFLPAPIFVGDDGTVHLKAYTAAYPMATVDGKATSRSGVFNNLYSQISAITAARTLGKRYTVTQTSEWYTECLYMWVEFATRHLQSVMASASSMPYSANEKAIVAETNTNRIIVSAASAAKFVVGQTIGIGTSLGATNVANNRVITVIEEYDTDNKVMSFDGDPVNITAGNIVFTLAWKNGSCDNVIASSGSPVSNTNGRYNCIYRGKERPYGDSFEWISDVLLKREGAGTSESPYTYDVYFLPDATKYTNGTLTEDYVKMNFRIPAADGYVKELGLDSRFPWVRIPCKVGAGSTTYYSDYYYYPRYATCAARVGGYWDGGSDAGPVYWHCYSAPSDSTVYCRARLSCRR